MEWELQQAGFDYTYDKRLYDRLVAGVATPVREHLMADPGFQQRSLRFIENHDEPRAAAVFPPPMHRAAATVALLARGLRLVHDGQFDGRKTHVSMHVGRRPPEPLDLDLRSFYERLFQAMRRPEARDGEWRLWPCRPAWDGNPTAAQFIVASWLLVPATGRRPRRQGPVPRHAGLGSSGVHIERNVIFDPRHRHHYLAEGGGGDDQDETNACRAGGNVVWRAGGGRTGMRQRNVNRGVLVRGSVSLHLLLSG
jgi:hypothetical protein